MSRKFFAISNSIGLDILWIIPDDNHFKVAFWNEQKQRFEWQGLTFSALGLGAMIAHIFNHHASYAELRKRSLTWSKL